MIYENEKNAEKCWVLIVVIGSDFFVGVKFGHLKK